MWTLICQEPPPENARVLTKIEDFNGSRNEQELIKKGNLYWTVDRKMYVYYAPTHWWKP